MGAFGKNPKNATKIILTYKNEFSYSTLKSSMVAIIIRIFIHTKIMQIYF
jgi:hypothetical protein